MVFWGLSSPPVVLLSQLEIVEQNVFRGAIADTIRIDMCFLTGVSSLEGMSTTQWMKPLRLSWSNFKLDLLLVVLVQI